MDFGGDDDDDDSGVFRYVRIEYPGYVIGPNNELNGLTLGAVGRGTEIEYVQVRRASDDCFEWFGGTVDVKHLICQHNEDDGFDIDNGYSGRMQFLILQQNPAVTGDHNGIEGDNDATGSAAVPVTAPTIYNATLCGKNMDVDKEQYGMLLRRRIQAQVFNTVVMGFEAGIDVRDASPITVQNSIFFGNVIHNVAYPEVVGGSGLLADDDSGYDELAVFLDVANDNLETDPGIGDCFDANNPDFAPATSLTANAAMPPDDGFFEQVSYVGAVEDASDTWATGDWVVWSDE